MAIQADIKDALDGGRDELVRVLAEHGVRPTVIDEGGESSLPGTSPSPTFRLDEADGSSAVVDRQTTALVVDALGLDSAEACESVREEIAGHDAWSE